MEQAILKTLIYADLFDFPMKVWEIHRWLYGKKVTLFQVEKVLKRKRFASRLNSQGDYYFIKGRKGLVKKRLEREVVSGSFNRQVSIIGFILRIVPWIKLLGISGSLAMGNSDKLSDIDLFVVSQKRRLWLTRICVLSILGFLGKRRRRTDSETDAAGKFCVNVLIEEDQTRFPKGDIYLAHEILQMKVVWDRKGAYSRFLNDNEWVFKVLPNWTSTYPQELSLKDYEKQLLKPVTRRADIMDFAEKVFRWLQIRYMGRISGKERVLSRALFLHPHDMRERVIKRFSKECEIILSK